MSMVQQMERIGQVPANMAEAALEMMDDAAAGWELLRQMDLAELDAWAEHDPHLARWLAYDVQPAEMREDWVGE